MYDMLDFTLSFQPAVDTMTAIHNLDLQKYELSPEEWEISELHRFVNPCRYNLQVAMGMGRVWISPVFPNPYLQGGSQVTAD